MNNKIFKLKTKNQISKLLAFLRIVYFNNNNYIFQWSTQIIKKKNFLRKKEKLFQRKQLKLQTSPSHKFNKTKICIKFEMNKLLIKMLKMMQIKRKKSAIWTMNCKTSKKIWEMICQIPTIIISIQIEEVN